jgi:hypothetical protein
MYLGAVRHTREEDMPPISIQAAVGKGAKNEPADVLVVKQELVRLGFDWLSADGVMGPTTIKAIQLFQAIINGWHVVRGSGVDGRIDPNGQTLRWLNARNAPRWMPMPAGGDGFGFVNDELLDKSDSHDFGTSWLAVSIEGAARDYRDGHLAANPGAARIHLNDVSVPRGGDTPDHATHETGTSCDIKLPRKDGAAGGIKFRSSLYDRAAARAILIALQAQPLAERVFFNDRKLIDEGLCRESYGHDDHIHFDVRPPNRED